ncbi:alanine--tRNA ligase [Moritella viscosa]|uniref:Alanine--tRNA ligase n=1 Tax=Moritella viscosa TaxID=80854 RepID=A0ABY1H7F2_9GAMM|nr:alanine--tRNA ligase [Moritella viscosa]CED58510.1 alanyl-tRNA synthetase [Moritella viscosa]SGY82154.1 Alanyl-tRNA synthetase [Moritella viscosa]SGY82769.1 Alanyl-tRNA synthetase [Moritella viscosa]SHN96577.1 Alanyl-tRNA synthetase [Moritella viscosa]SHN96578.1 Alanyl-tRNA synthetase [Moritella viscosa]
MTMSTAEIRNAFLDYFASKGHNKGTSSSLVPANDPTLLFTNAGMNQFKDVFLGAEQRSYTRATTSQRCVRAGGKHNDLDNVGYTARHHTFFEMLGNFSFGDYFKEDAILFAWEFLTVVLKLPKEKLLVTVYESDDEAFSFWANKIGVPEDKIIRIGDKSPEKKFESDNFWSMGDTGPCGPCSEIFYDHGEDIWGGVPGSPEEDGDRFIEIWNLVFMQFNRQADGTMEELPKPSVDTGMGLERISAIMQNVHSNYEIDIFQSLIKHVAELIGTTDLENKSLRVIADHIRACSFLISDGVMPSNEGRGYVLRRIIRRAVRHGNKLGAKGPFFNKLVAKMVELMGDISEDLVKQQAIVEKILLIEEEQFGKTLERGLNILDNELSQLDGKVVPGDVVFKLYDTYGFPSDLTADIARERELTIDEDGFKVAMEEQRNRARQGSNFGTDYNEMLKVDVTTEFLGYQTLTSDAQIVALIKDNTEVELLNDGQEGAIVLDKTPFYAEAGGQSGDQGVIKIGDTVFTVTDTKKAGNATVHFGSVSGVIEVNTQVIADVDVNRRKAIGLNHSVTHLAHAALRKVVGENVQQKGSLVLPERLRFDFSHFEGVTSAQLLEVERLVNAQIRANHEVVTEVMDIDAAREAGAMALFGEKYDDEVRVVRMGDFSIELCGGTHVKRTGDIGFFKILSESGIAAGVRRVEAVTGDSALAYVHDLVAKMQETAGLVKADQNTVVAKVSQVLDRNRSLEKEVEKLNVQVASAANANLIDQVQVINGVKVLVANLKGADPKSLRSSMDELKNKLQSGIIVLGIPGEGKVNLITGVTKDLIGKVKAGELVSYLAVQVGGKGGGRPDMAQAGGSNPEALPAALESVTPWLTEKL